MRRILPDLADATPAPVFDVVEPSLVVAVPTAMVLVDYALGGLATPTPESQAVASRLDPELVVASHPVRAVLAHGTQLREFLLGAVRADDDAHRDWAALRRWIRDLDDRGMSELVEAGVRANLSFAAATSREPTGDRDQSGPVRTVLQNALRVLEMWGVPDAPARAAELADPGLVRTTLLALLESIWELWLASAWRALGAAPEPARTPAVTSSYTGSQWISRITGLRPDHEYAAAADRAAHLSLMACPGLGRSLSLFEVGDHTWVLFSPTSNVVTDRAGPVRAGVAVTGLGRLIPVMRALGDPTRLAIVLHILNHGPVTMTQLADALQVHQTTVSRQVAALRAARIASQDEHRRIVIDRDDIREACLTLLDELA